jgi:hypothetical protein
VNGADPTAGGAQFTVITDPLRVAVTLVGALGGTHGVPTVNEISFDMADPLTLLACTRAKYVPLGALAEMDRIEPIGNAPMFDAPDEVPTMST